MREARMTPHEVGHASNRIDIGSKLVFTPIPFVDRWSRRLLDRRSRDVRIGTGWNDSLVPELAPKPLLNYDALIYQPAECVSDRVDVNPGDRVGQLPDRSGTLCP
jgi:hypothetical protein